MATIHVEEAALNSLKNAIGTAGAGFKDNYARLSALIQEITSGDIKGDPADDLKAKYEAKREVFDGVVKTIEEAEEYMGMQSTKFGTMIGDLQSTMK